MLFRNWFSWLVNVPLFLSACVDFYKFHYVWGIVASAMAMGFTTMQWSLWNRNLRSAREWKMKWAELALRGEQRLKELQAHKENGFE